MNKLFAIFLFGLLTFGISTPSFSDENEHHYAWILSCTTVYRTFPYELSDDECVDMLEDFEKQYCGDVDYEVEEDENIDIP